MTDAAFIDIVSLSTTVGSQEDARRLAGELIGQGLAACVQIEGGLESHYRWEGRPCQDAEWRLTVKTLEAQLPAIEALFARVHPYELPQLTWELQRAGARFGDWLREQLGPAQA